MRSGATDEELKTLITQVWRDRTDRGAEERLALPARGALTKSPGCVRTHIGRGTREEIMTLQVALLEPQIPPNTGNIARLCAAQGRRSTSSNAGLSLADADVNEPDSIIGMRWISGCRGLVRVPEAVTGALPVLLGHGDRSFWDAPYHEARSLYSE